MDTVHAIQAMTTLGYIAAAFRILASIVLYFTIPKIINFIYKNKDYQE